MRIPATVTRQNQITVPVAVRDRLGVNGGGTVVFNVTDRDIVIEERDLTLDEIRGSLELSGPLASDDFDAEIEEAMGLETARYVDHDRLGRL